MPKSLALILQPFPTTCKSSALAVKKTTLYKERNEKKRTLYQQAIEPLNPADLVYVDECGLDERIYRHYARAPLGEKVMANITGLRAERTSIIAGLSQKNILAPWHFSGYCNTAVITTWVEHELLPTLRAGMTIIWDNATFHKHSKIKSLVEDAGCSLVFLPPYSPDLNPIEQFWAVLKARIRRLRKKAMTIPEALAQLFGKAHYLLE
jgi:transposase